MNFTEAVAEVQGIVKRPDKILDYRREVNAAVNFFSSDSNFKRDIAEVLLAIDVLAYSQNILFTDLPRFRKIQFMKRGGTRQYLSELNTKDLTSAECALDKYYIAGAGVRINMRALASTLDIGYYQYPPYLTDSAPVYWMLDSSPFMVIDRAAGSVFRDIGDDASSRTHMASSNVAYLAFRNDQGV